jgi:hypothetical protein
MRPTLQLRKSRIRRGQGMGLVRKRAGALLSYSGRGRAEPGRARCRKVGWRCRVGFPAVGLSSMLSQDTAFSSYSRLPQTSQTQAGKFCTVMSSSPNHVK